MSSVHTQARFEREKKSLVPDDRILGGETKNERSKNKVHWFKEERTKKVQQCFLSVVKKAKFRADAS